MASANPILEGQWGGERGRGEWGGESGEVRVGRGEWGGESREGESGEGERKERCQLFFHLKPPPTSPCKV